MEWRDQGLIIGTRRHGETSLILEVMTSGHGRHLGLVKGGRGKRTAPLLQPGNEVDVTWRARLEEHLGFFQIEATKLRTSELMSSPAALHAANHVAGLLRLLAERDPHGALLAEAIEVLDASGHLLEAAARMVAFEVSLLAESGFGIDMDSCAATGSTRDLIYVSPRSGRAVCRAAGEPYRDRLLPLPAFLKRNGAATTVDRDTVLSGFELTGFFLRRDLFAPRGYDLPDARHAFLECLRRDL